MHMKFALVVVLAVPLVAQGWVDRTAAGGPPTMYSPHMCYDPIRNYMVLVGNVAGVPSAQTWSYDGVAWTARGGAPHSGPVAVDGVSGQLLLATYQGTYAWDGTGWQGAGGGTGGYTLEDIAFDPLRQQLIAVGNLNNAMVTWRWSTSSWQQVSVTSNANIYPPQDRLSLAFDPVSQKILLAASAATYVLLGGVYVQVPVTRWYEWNGFGWNQRLPLVAPASAGAMATDTLRQRIVMFDGDYNNGPNSNLPNHTWSISNGVLTRLTTPIEPSLRNQAAFAFDPVRSVCVLFGGYNGGGYLADTWEFDLGPVASFTSFGTGCVGSRGIPNLAAQGTSLPRVGSTFTAHITNLPWTGPALLVLGLSNTSYSSTPLPIDLGFLGAPTCSLRASIDDIQGIVNVLGAATWSWTIPPVPGASFYTQVLPLDPGLNALGLTASNACHGVIGL